MKFYTTDTLQTKHGFFTRKGGVSEGIFSSLNVGIGSEDNPEHVAQNRNLIKESLEAKSLLSLYQIHSNEVIVADENTSRVEGDAIVTTTEGLAIGILTADCVPILFHDPVNHVIGAAHAGWKGALAGITNKTINTMIEQGAQRQHITACVGPCIAQVSYEVDYDFRAIFLENETTNIQYFIPSNKEGHFLFNLAGYVLTNIRKQHLAHVEHIYNDTYAQAEEFFSYRHSCHNNEPHYGRQISAICL